MVAIKEPRRYSQFRSIDGLCGQTKLNAATRATGVRETLLQCSASLEAVAFGFGDSDQRIQRLRGAIEALADQWK